jgi:hypothetical protein
LRSKYKAAWMTNSQIKAEYTRLWIY